MASSVGSGVRVRKRKGYPISRFPRLARKSELITSRIVNTLLPEEPEKRALAERLARGVVFFLEPRKEQGGFVTGRVAEDGRIRLYGRFSPGTLAHEVFHKIEFRKKDQLANGGRFANAIGFLFEPRDRLFSKSFFRWEGEIEGAGAAEIENRMVEKLHSEAKRALGVEEVSARALGISEGMLRHGVADKIWGAGIAAAARKMAREVKNPDAMWDYISERWAGKQPNDAWEAVLKKYRR